MVRDDDERHYNIIVVGRNRPMAISSYIYSSLPIYRETWDQCRDQEVVVSFVSLYQLSLDILEAFAFVSSHILSSLLLSIAL